VKDAHANTVPVALDAVRAPAKIADFIALAKPRLNLLVVATSAAGYYLGSPAAPDLWPMAKAVVGTAVLEVFRQRDQVRSTGSRLVGEGNGCGDVRLRVGPGIGLEEGDGDDHRVTLAARPRWEAARRDAYGPRLAGTGDPDSSRSVSAPSRPTRYDHVCRSMQPAWPSPQPMVTFTV